MDLTINDCYFSEEELQNTPKRFNRFLKEWLIDSNEFEFTTFENPGYDELIIVKNINFYSMCSHHLVPFFGEAHIGYIPKELLCGLSKLPRTVDKFAHKPQIQEKLTIEIKDFLVKQLKPLWLMVVLQAEHLCISMRGIKKPGHITTTNAIYPSPKDNPQFNHVKTEFLEMITK